MQSTLHLNQLTKKMLYFFFLKVAPLIVRLICPFCVLSLNHYMRKIRCKNVRLLVIYVAENHYLLLRFLLFTGKRIPFSKSSSIFTEEGLGTLVSISWKTKHKKIVLNNFVKEILNVKRISDKI